MDQILLESGTYEIFMNIVSGSVIMASEEKAISSISFIVAKKKKDYAWSQICILMVVLRINNYCG